MLIRDILARNARVHPNRVALVSGDRTVTYRELARAVEVRAASLRALGLGKGDRAAVLTPNSPAYMEILFAAAEIGCVLVPLNCLLIGREIKEILGDADARVLLYAGPYAAVAAEIAEWAGSSLRVVAIDGAAAEPGNGGAPAAPAPPQAEDTAVIEIYTSGTSGRPKGAMLSHRNLISAAASAALELGLSRNDVYLACAPLPFIAGTGRLLRVIYVGGTIVILPRFDPEEVLAAIGRRRVTHVLFTPTMIARILDLPGAERHDLSTLRTVLYGGASIPIELLKRAIPFFGGRLVQSYGKLESTGVLTFLHEEDHRIDESLPDLRKLMSIGQEAIGVEVRVVDDAGREIGGNEVGEIVARGPNIFEGYYRDPEFTAEVLRDGWFHTGDVASVDEDGYIYVVDRKRDVLMTGGISVSPREIENILAEHPAVQEAAVIGRADYTWGEVPVAVVVPKEGQSVDAESLLAFCRQNMASFKIPRSIDFLGTLPRNSQGKVLKARLRERMAGRRRR